MGRHDHDSDPELRRDAGGVLGTGAAKRDQGALARVDPVTNRDLAHGAGHVGVHRGVDGGPASRLLQRIKRYLETCG